MPHQCTDCGRTFADGSKEMLSGCPDCGGNKFQFLPASAAAADSGAGPETGGSAGGTAPKKAPDEPTRSPSSGSRPRSESSAGRGLETPASAADASAGPETEGGDASAVDRAAATVRDWVRSGGREDSDESRTDHGESRTDHGESRTDHGESRTDHGESRTDHGDSHDDADSHESHADRAVSTRNGAGESRTAAPEDAAQADARSGVVSEAELPDRSQVDPPASGSRADSSDGEIPDEPPADGEVVDTPNEESPGLKELREELNSQFESIRIVEPGQYELNLMELYEREEYIIALKEDGKYVIEVPDGWETPDR